MCEPAWEIMFVHPSVHNNRVSIGSDTAKSSHEIFKGYAAKNVWKLEVGQLTTIYSILVFANF